MSNPNAKARIDLLSLIKPAGGGSAPSSGASTPSAGGSASPVGASEPENEAAGEAAKPRFTYVNPFFSLESSSPVSRFKNNKTESLDGLSDSGSAGASATPSVAASTAPSPAADAARLLAELRVTPAEPAAPVAAAPAAPAAAGPPAAGRRVPLGALAVSLPAAAGADGEFGDDACIPIANFAHPPYEHDRSVLAADTSYIAYPVSAGQIRVISQADGSYTVLTGHEESRIISLAFAPSSTGTSLLVSTTESSEIIAWELLTRAFVKFPNQNQYRKLLKIEKMPPNSEHFPKSVVHWSAIPDTLGVTIGKRVCLFPLSFNNFTDVKRSYLTNNLAEKASACESTTAIKDFCVSADGTVVAALDKRHAAVFWDATAVAAVDGDDASAAKPLIKDLVLGLPNRDDTAYSSIFLVDAPETYKTPAPKRFALLGYNQNRSFQLVHLASRALVNEFHLPASDKTPVSFVEYFASAAIVVLSDAAEDKFYFVHVAFPPVEPGQTGSQAEYVRALKPLPAGAAAPAVAAGVDYVSTYTFGGDRTVISFTLLEPTSVPDVLFDIYVGHSKGATIISVKNTDVALGAWALAADWPGLATKALDKPLFDEPKGDDKAKGKDAGERQVPIRKHIISPFTTLKAQKAKKLAASAAASPAVSTPTSTSPSSPAPADDEPAKDKEPKEPAKQIMSILTAKPSSPLSAAPVTAPEPAPAAVPAPAPLAPAPDAPVDTDDTKDRKPATQKKKKEILTRKTDSAKRDNLLADLFKPAETAGAAPAAPAPAAAAAASPASPASPVDLGSQDMVRTISESIGDVIRQNIYPSLEATLQSYIDRSLQKSFARDELVSSLSREISRNIAGEVAAATKKAIAQVERASAEAMMRHSAAMDAKLNQALAQLGQVSQQEAKIDMLLNQVNILSAEVQSLRSAAVNGGAEAPPKSEADVLKHLLSTGQCEDALSLWIASKQKEDLFAVLMLFDANTVCRSASPMLLLSIIAACSNSLLDHISHKLLWVEAALNHLDLSEKYVKEFAPKVLPVVINNISQAFDKLADVNPRDASLRKLPIVEHKITMLLSSI
ncbi:uncharacterized protein V1510DRAFT_431334 [Dipodascopsis tothii]|uniref:uncharacterized protein n=1 Tax=Dipodascopsis tothii TaxID=44089 RepID=UPI0034CEED8D